MQVRANDPLIRRAVRDDLDALLPLVQAYREFYGQGPDAAGERRFMHGHLERNTSVVFLAEDGSLAVGFVQLFPAFSTVHLAPSLILEDLFVDPAARQRGVARALLAAASDYARAAGAAGMFLETAHDNAAAQRVYEAAGWTREGRFYKYNAPL